MKMLEKWSILHQHRSLWDIAKFYSLEGFVVADDGKLRKVTTVGVSVNRHPPAALHAGQWVRTVSGMDYELGARRALEAA